MSNGSAVISCIWIVLISMRWYVHLRLLVEWLFLRLLPLTRRCGGMEVLAGSWLSSVVVMGVLWVRMLVVLLRVSRIDLSVVLLGVRWVSLLVVPFSVRGRRLYLLVVESSVFFVRSAAFIVPIISSVVMLVVVFVVGSVPVVIVVISLIVVPVVVWPVRASIVLLVFCSLLVASSFLPTVAVVVLVATAAILFVPKCAVLVSFVLVAAVVAALKTSWCRLSSAKPAPRPSIVVGLLAPIVKVGSRELV